MYSVFSAFKFKENRFNRSDNKLSISYASQKFLAINAMSSANTKAPMYNPYSEYPKFALIKHLIILAIIRLNNNGLVDAPYLTPF